jgi:hypothetical protein
MGLKELKTTLSDNKYTIIGFTLWLAISLGMLIPGIYMLPSKHSVDVEGKIANAQTWNIGTPNYDNTNVKIEYVVDGKTYQITASDDKYKKFRVSLADLIALKKDPTNERLLKKYSLDDLVLLNPSVKYKKSNPAEARLGYANKNEQGYDDVSGTIIEAVSTEIGAPRYINNFTIQYVLDGKTYEIKKESTDIVSIQDVLKQSPTDPMLKKSLKYDPENPADAVYPDDAKQSGGGLALVILGGISLAIWVIVVGVLYILPLIENLSD